MNRGGGRKAGSRGSSSGSRATGTVKSYNAEKGYGFIVSPSANGDLMFLRTDLPPDMKEVRGRFIENREVTFDVSTVDGKNKATNLQVVPKEGEMYAGKIKSYSENNLYGFIESSMSPGEDFKFSITDLDALHPGVTLTDELVQFMPMRKKNGKLSVSKLQFQSSKIASRLKVGGSEAPSGAVAREPVTLPGGLTMDTLSQLVTMLGGHLPANAAKRAANLAAVSVESQAKKQKMTPTTKATGQFVTGIIKSWSTAKKFGFIESDSVPKDIFFMASDLPDGVGLVSVSQGMPVSCDVLRTSDGKLRASNLSL